MDKHVLAQQLRKRQYARGYLPRHLIDAVSDGDIIDSYITCSCCWEKQVNSQQLKVAIAQARDASHFLTICDEQARAASRGTSFLRLAPTGLFVACACACDKGLDQGRSVGIPRHPLSRIRRKPEAPYVKNEGVCDAPLARFVGQPWFLTDPAPSENFLVMLVRKS